MAELNNILFLAIITIIVLFLLNTIFVYYSKVKLYPLGPTPIPFIGNILSMYK
jgi:hypothetical protein